MSNGETIKNVKTVHDVYSMRAVLRFYTHNIASIAQALETGCLCHSLVSWQWQYFGDTGDLFDVIFLTKSSFQN
jgi:hypothetical protein